MTISRRNLLATAGASAMTLPFGGALAQKPASSLHAL